MILCEMDVQILCKCSDGISRFQMENLTSDTAVTLLNSRTDYTDNLSIFRLLAVVELRMTLREVFYVVIKN